jgi:hypothetical protein
MVQHVLAELHDFRGADDVEKSDWVLQVSLCVYVSAPLVYLACGLGLSCNVCEYQPRSPRSHVWACRLHPPPPPSLSFCSYVALSLYSCR